MKHSVINTFYDRLLRPVLFQLDPETAHNLASNSIRAVDSFSRLTGNLHSRLQEWLCPFNSRLKVQCGSTGLAFPNPVGLAAGFDKNAHLLSALSLLGFGSIELGAVTNQPSPGNAKPRLFRLPADKALINRMGLNNGGAELFRQNLVGELKKLKHDQHPPLVGINIAKTHTRPGDSTISGDKAIEDYLASITTTHPLGDYLTLNISCPNASDGKTFEDPESLDNLLHAVNETRQTLGDARPLFVKLSPDSTDSDFLRLLEVTENRNVAGYVLSNTSAARSGLVTASKRLDEIGKGGLSGRPLFQGTLSRVALARKTLGPHKPIIAVGGISSASDVFNCLLAGACSTQIYSALVYRGPTLPWEISRGLLDLLNEHGVSHVSEIIGQEAG